MVEHLFHPALHTRVVIAVLIFFMLLFARERQSKSLKEKGLNINDMPNQGWPKSYLLFIFFFPFLAWSGFFNDLFGINISNLKIVLFFIIAILFFIFWFWSYRKNRDM